MKTRLSLTGPLVVARDIAHAKIAERLDAGEPMPQYLRDHAVYYAGPAKTPEGYASGSFGPTTAGRMDSYVEKFQAAGGSLVMLAKGNRSARSTERLPAARRLLPRLDRRPGRPAGPGLHQHVEVLEYPELGMEAVWKIEVEDFPAFIVVDDKGNDFFADPSGAVTVPSPGSAYVRLSRRPTQEDHMQCPNDGAVLTMSERSGIEIDYCPTCRGVWLDRGELDKIIERSLAPQLAAGPPRSASTAVPGASPAGLPAAPYKAQQSWLSEQSTKPPPSLPERACSDWLTWSTSRSPAPSPSAVSWCCASGAPRTGRRSLELRANGVFVMDTVEVSTERALARAALALVDDPRAVLVGGLGLGFTMHEVLADSRVEHCSVVEIEQALVDWMRDGTVPHGPALLADERVNVVVADVAVALAEARPATYDLVLLDVDNGPGYLVHAGNAALYEPCRRSPPARAVLRPGGALVVWSADEAPDARGGDARGLRRRVEVRAARGAAPGAGRALLALRRAVSVRLSSDAGSVSEPRTFRIEHDSMGEVRVPADALWRAQTQRAVENFPISGTPIEPRLDPRASAT